MKSKVILFSILLFCSKIVDSIPHSEDLVRQRVNPLSNWQVDQNAPNVQYLDTDFTQTQDVNIQQDKTQDYYSNEGRYNYDSRNPASSPSVQELLVSYDSPADGRRSDPFSHRVESYPSRTSQVEFDNQQYRNQNWRSQSQYTNSAPSAVLIPDDEMPVVTTVQEPYRGPVQYVQPKYVPSSNRRFYQPGRSYLTRDQFQYLRGDGKYVANSAPRFGSSDRRYAQSFANPALRATATMTDQSENIKYLENYKSGSDLSNTAPLSNYDDGLPVISEADNTNSDSIPSNLAHVDSKKEAPVDISKILSEKPLARRYANNYRPDSGWSNIARDDSFNGAPELTETVRVKSGKYEANYESNYGPKEPVPINTYSGAYSAPPHTELVNSGSNKHEESNVARHGSSSPAPLNTNTKQNVYHKLTSGMTEFNLKGLAANPDVQNILAGTTKRYVVVHSNGTVEYLDKLDLESHQNSKLRLVHTKRKNIDDSDSEGVFTQQSPENLPNNIANTPVPADESPLPTNNQPADDKKPTTPLQVDQANSADEYDSNPSPPLKHLPSDHSNLKPLPQSEKQPADNKNSKLLPSYVILPADDDNSTPLTTNEDQPAQTNVKPLPQDVIQPGDDDNSKPLTSHVNETAVDGNSIPLPQDGNQPANYTNSKPLPTNENQPDDDRPFHPYRRQPAQYYNRSKHSHANQPADNNNSNPSSPDENQSTNENQSGDDNDSKSLRANENQPTDDLKSKQNLADSIKNDDQYNSTTVSPTALNDTTPSKPQVIKTHKRKHIHRKSATNSPVVNSTPGPDDTSEEQLITISPIEQATDNVSDVPPETTTTTTTRPEKSDTVNDTNNKQDDVQDNTAQTYSTTTLSPSSSASPTDNTSDDKTKENTESKNTKTNDKTVVDQVNNGKNDTQTAVYNSSELFDTNTDVPDESGDYSSVTASPSVQNDVNTGDASGDNSLELEQSETDVTITVSSSDNDSEETTTINIEVSESTDDADSSSNDKSLVVSINTNDDSDDDSKTPKPEDCKKDQNSVDGRGKNVEIDMSNLKGEPTMWIRTTNQDFIDKLTAKNETEFDVIYFFHIDNQPVIERENKTTIYCNGTVVTETTEVTYANKDDPTPTVVKTTKTTQITDDEAVVV